MSSLLTPQCVQRTQFVPTPVFDPPHYAETTAGFPSASAYADFAARLVFQERSRQQDTCVRLCVGVDMARAAHSDDAAARQTFEAIAAAADAVKENAAAQVETLERETVRVWQWLHHERLCAIVAEKTISALRAYVEEQDLDRRDAYEQIKLLRVQIARLSEKRQDAATHGDKNNQVYSVCPSSPCRDFPATSNIPENQHKKTQEPKKQNNQVSPCRDFHATNNIPENQHKNTQEPKKQNNQVYTVRPYSPCREVPATNNNQQKQDKKNQQIKKQNNASSQCNPSIPESAPVDGGKQQETNEKKSSDAKFNSSREQATHRMEVCATSGGKDGQDEQDGSEKQQKANADDDGRATADQLVDSDCVMASTAIVFAPVELPVASAFVEKVRARRKQMLQLHDWINQPVLSYAIASVGASVQCALDVVGVNVPPMISDGPVAFRVGGFGTGMAHAEMVACHETRTDKPKPTHGGSVDRVDGLCASDATGTQCSGATKTPTAMATTTPSAMVTSDGRDLFLCDNCDDGDCIDECTESDGDNGWCMGGTDGGGSAKADVPTMLPSPVVVETPMCPKRLRSVPTGLRNELGPQDIKRDGVPQKHPSTLGGDDADGDQTLCQWRSENRIAVAHALKTAALLVTRLRRLRNTGQQGLMCEKPSSTVLLDDVEAGYRREFDCEHDEDRDDHGHAHDHQERQPQKQEQPVVVHVSVAVIEQDAVCRGGDSYLPPHSGGILRRDSPFSTSEGIQSVASVHPYVLFSSSSSSSSDDDDNTTTTRSGSAANLSSSRSGGAVTPSGIQERADARPAAGLLIDGLACGRGIDKEDNSDDGKRDAHRSDGIDDGGGSSIATENALAKLAVMEAMATRTGEQTQVPQQKSQVDGVGDTAGGTSTADDFESGSVDQPATECVQSVGNDDPGQQEDLDELQQALDDSNNICGVDSGAESDGVGLETNASAIGDNDHDQHEPVDHAEINEGQPLLRISAEGVDHDTQSELADQEASDSAAHDGTNDEHTHNDLDGADNHGGEAEQLQALEQPRVELDVEPTTDANGGIAYWVAQLAIIWTDFLQEKRPMADETLRIGVRSHQIESTESVVSIWGYVLFGSTSSYSSSDYNGADDHIMTRSGAAANLSTTKSGKVAVAFDFEAGNRCAESVDDFTTDDEMTDDEGDNQDLWPERALKNTNFDAWNAAIRGVHSHPSESTDSVTSVYPRAPFGCSSSRPSNDSSSGGITQSENHELSGAWMIAARRPLLAGAYTDEIDARGSREANQTVMPTTTALEVASSRTGGPQMEASQRSRQPNGSVQRGQLDNAEDLYSLMSLDDLSIYVGSSECLSYDIDCDPYRVYVRDCEKDEGEQDGEDIEWDESDWEEEEEEEGFVCQVSQVADEKEPPGDSKRRGNTTNVDTENMSSISNNKGDTEDDPVVLRYQVALQQARLSDQRLVFAEKIGRSRQAMNGLDYRIERVEAVVRELRRKVETERAKNRPKAASAVRGAERVTEPEAGSGREADSSDQLRGQVAMAGAGSAWEEAERALQTLGRVQAQYFEAVDIRVRCLTQQQQVEQQVEQQMQQMQMQLQQEKKTEAENNTVGDRGADR